MRIRWWKDLCNDSCICKWLITTALAKEAFMTSERMTFKMCHTTKQFVKMTDTTPILTRTRATRNIS